LKGESVHSHIHISLIPIKSRGTPSGGAGHFWGYSPTNAFSAPNSKK
jgi:hypothetical protein